MAHYPSPPPLRPLLRPWVQVCSFTCPEGTQFSHPSLRSGQTFGSPPTHFIRYPYGGAQNHLRTVVLRQVSQLSAPYYFYTFNFPTPATLVPPHYSLCSFFLEQSCNLPHLRSFSLRLSPYGSLYQRSLYPLHSNRADPLDQGRQRAGRCAEKVNDCW